jgi:hypothetical protein
VVDDYDVAAQHLCCPSGWQLFPTPLPSQKYLACFVGYTNGTIYGLQTSTATTGTIAGIPFGGFYNETQDETDLTILVTRSYPLASLPILPLSTGSIIGIAVGCGLVGPIAFFGAVFYFLRRRRQKKRNAATAQIAASKHDGPKMPEMGEGLRHELEPEPWNIAPTIQRVTELHSNNIIEMEGQGLHRHELQGQTSKARESRPQTSTQAPQASLRADRSHDLLDPLYLMNSPLHEYSRIYGEHTYLATGSGQ